MTIYLATKTLTQINNCLEFDQGSLYRAYLQKVLPHIGDAYRQGKEDFRSHMGASGIGKECARAIWYDFRWHTKKTHPGRIVRLFNRGHLEEGRFIALLLMIGVEVFQQDENGKQFAIHGSEGHYGGSGDGVVKHVPDIPVGNTGLTEFKTHGDKSFSALAGKSWTKYLEGLWGRGPAVAFDGEGVRSAKFEHYVQMQQYMFKMDISYALYMAVNKNTDEIYAEIVVLDTDFAGKFADRADRIIWMKQPPKKLSESPGFFACKFCDHRPVCHLGETPAMNCRSCAHSYPAAEKQWGCKLHNIGLTKETQLLGCKDWSAIKEDRNASETA